MLELLTIFTCLHMVRGTVRGRLGYSSDFNLINHNFQYKENKTFGIKILLFAFVSTAKLSFYFMS